MNDRQLNAEERGAPATLQRLGWSVLEMARELGRHRSTSARELKRNAAPPEGWSRAGRAHERAIARRRRSRRNSQFAARDGARVETLLREEWSSTATRGSRRPAVCASTLPPRIIVGNAGPTKTPMASSASISPRARA